MRYGDTKIELIHECQNGFNIFSCLNCGEVPYLYVEDTEGVEFGSTPYDSEDNKQRFIKWVEEQ